MATLTANSSAVSPNVIVTFSSGDLSGSVSTINVIQSSALGDVVVRGGERLAAVGGATITDYEAPLGMTVTYWAEQFNSSGTSLGLSASASTSLTIDPTEVVVQDPLAPNNAVRLDAEAGFAATVRSQRELQLHRRGNDTIALMGQKGLLEDIPIRLNTRTADDADMLETILDETQVLIRSMPAATVLPPVLHVVIPNPMQVPKDVQWGGTWVLWDMTGFQVSRNSLEVIVPVLTYQRYMDYYATYTAAKAAYTTYLDSKLNPPPEA